MSRKIKEPCPRCQSIDAAIESHPATGVLIECRKCGACSDSSSWGKGLILLQRDGKHRRPVTEKYLRTTQDQKGKP